MKMTGRELKLKEIEEMFDFLKSKKDGERMESPEVSANASERVSAEELRRFEKARAELKQRIQEVEAKREQKHQELMGKIFPERTMTEIEFGGERRGETSALAMDCALPGMGGGASLAQRMMLDREIIDRMPAYFIGWDTCAVLAQNWLIDRACTIPGEDAVSAGWDLEYSESVSKDETITEEGQAEQAKRLKEIEHSAGEYDLVEVLKKAERIKKIFGYSLVVPDIEGVDMSKPFTPDTPIRHGAYKGLAVIEPMWVIPQLGENGLNPASKDFYTPEWYRVATMDMRIHRSWCLKLVNSPVPDRLKPAYFFGGVSLTQQIFKRVYAAESVANEAPNLAMTKRLRWLTGSLENAVANPDLIDERMKMLVELADNYSTVLVGEDGRVGQLDTSLTDFDEMTMTQYQLVAAVAQVPVTKLMKTQVRGFDNSGTYERDDYNQALRTIQENDFTPIIQRHNMLFSRSEYGENMALTVRWREIQLPSPKEAAEIRLIDAQRDAHLIHASVISPDEAREHLRNDDKSGYTELADMMEGETLSELESGDYVPDYVGTSPDKGMGKPVSAEA